MDRFELHKQMILFFLSGAIPISPAIYGGTPTPVLFDSPSCVQQFGFVNQRFVRIGGLPERLIDCGFINVLGSPPIARVNILIGPQQVVTSQTRLVGVRCDGKDGHISCRHGVHKYHMYMYNQAYIKCAFPVYIGRTFDPLVYSIVVTSFYPF